MYNTIKGMQRSSANCYLTISWNIHGIPSFHPGVYCYSRAWTYRGHGGLLNNKRSNPRSFFPGTLFRRILSPPVLIPPIIKSRNGLGARNGVKMELGIKIEARSGVKIQDRS